MSRMDELPSSVQFSVAEGYLFSFAFGFQRIHVRN